MTTERSAWISTLSVSMHQRQALATTCRCGQELDCCSRAHCPRCGTAISRRAESAYAA